MSVIVESRTRQLQILNATGFETATTVETSIETRGISGDLRIFMAINGVFSRENSAMASLQSLNMSTPPRWCRPLLILSTILFITTFLPFFSPLVIYCWTTFKSSNQSMSSIAIHAQRRYQTLFTLYTFSLLHPTTHTHPFSLSFSISFPSILHTSTYSPIKSTFTRMLHQISPNKHETPRIDGHEQSLISQQSSLTMKQHLTSPLPV